MRKTTVLDIHELLRYLQQGESERAIHAALGLSRNTIAKYRAWAEAGGLLREPLPTPAEIQAYLRATQPPTLPPTPSSVEPHRATVEALRQRGVEIQAVYQRLREAHGYAGSYAAVWRFVQKLEQTHPEVTVRIEVQPGDEAQVDFGYAGLMYDPQQQKLRKAWAFVMVLSWSRHQYVEFVFDQSVLTWIALHRRAFEFFRGVPKRVVLDNLKAAILKASWYDPQVQRAYRTCAEHYGFLLAPCKVATPQHKGKVESGGVHYVKRNFLAGRDYTTFHHNIRHANQDVQTWTRETAGQRRHGTTKQKPLECFTDVEQATLRRLPPDPFEPVLWKEAKLHRDCYLVFDNAYYSAPHRFVGQTLTVRATQKSIEIYAELELLATHTRAARPGERMTVLAHLPPHKVAGVTLSPLTCLERAMQLGPQTGEVVDQLLQERPVDRLRPVHSLLTLAEKTPDHAAQLEQACAQALAQHDVSLANLHALLAAAGEASQAELVPDWPRFARNPDDLVPAEWRR